MLDIIVIRGSGLVQGDDIVEPLLSTLAAMLARGEQELNETSTGKVDKSINVPFQTGVRPGLFAYVVDEFLDEEYVGKIISVDINVKGAPPSAFMQLRMEVPDDFFNPSVAVLR